IWRGSALCTVSSSASTRRHTSTKRDWSSDVCSSDLLLFSIDTGHPLILLLLTDQKRGPPSAAPSSRYPFLAFRNRDVVAGLFAGVHLARAADLRRRVVDHLAVLSDPPREPAEREQRGEHVGGEGHRLVDEPGVE